MSSDELLQRLEEGKKLRESRLEKRGKLEVTRKVAAEKEESLQADLKEMGIDPLHLAPANGLAGARQLEHRIRQEPEVMAARCRLNQITSTQNSLAAQKGAVPQQPQCSITWDPVEDETLRRIAEFAGIA